jgi:putative transposase
MLRPVEARMLRAKGRLCGQHGRLYSLRVIKGRPPRLERIFSSAPVYFVSFATLHRRRIPDLPTVHTTLRDFGERALQHHDVALGQYVIMPDHIHLFAAGPPHSFILGRWVSSLKRALSAKVGATAADPLWQPGFFDHLLRSGESYSSKWNYLSGAWECLEESLG